MTSAIIAELLQSHLAELDHTLMTAAPVALMIPQQTTFLLNSPDAICISQQDQIIYASPTCFALFAATRLDQIIGQSTLALFHPEDRPRLCEQLQRLPSSQLGAPTFDARIVRCDKTIVDVIITLSTYEDENGMTIQMILANLPTEQATDQAAVEVLRAGEERFRQLVESAPAYAIYMIDPRGFVVSWNTGAAQSNEYGAEEIVGQHIACFYTPEAIAQQQPEAELALAASKGSYQAEGWRVRKDGSQFWADIVITAQYDQGGELRGFIGTMREISAPKLLSSAAGEQPAADYTRELERRRQAAEVLLNILAMINMNQPVSKVLERVVSQATELLAADASVVLQIRGEQMVNQASFGFARPGFMPTTIPLNEDLRRFLNRRGDPIALPDLDKFDSSSAAFQQYRAQTQREGYHAVLAIPITVEKSPYGFLVMYYRAAQSFGEEVVELAHILSHQVALAIENDRLHSRLQRSTLAADRDRIARDLHDAVNQTLFSANLITEALLKRWDHNDNHAKANLEELQKLTRSALTGMHTLLFELRPYQLTDITTESLLRQAAEAVSSRLQIPITVTVDTIELPADIKVAYYRIAQEALQNVAKHARAQHVALSLKERAGAVELCIMDDGRGFNAEKIQSNHLGLNIMQERADSIDAALTIVSQPGHGTTVLVQWPRADKT